MSKRASEQVSQESRFLRSWPTRNGTLWNAFAGITPRILKGHDNELQKEMSPFNESAAGAVYKQTGEVKETVFFGEKNGFIFFISGGFLHTNFIFDRNTCVCRDLLGLALYYTFFFIYKIFQM